MFERYNITNKDKEGQQELIDLFKRECSSIIKLKHPNILRTMSTTNESSNAIVLETEPLLTCLASLLSTTPSGSSSHNSDDLKDYQLEDLEVIIF